MHILAVIRHQAGGIRTYIKYVYGRLPTHYRFTVIAVDGSRLDLISSDLAPHQVEVIKVRQRRAFAGLVRASAAQLASRRYDLMHSHGFTAGAAAATANLPFRVPHVLTCHEVLRPEQFGGRFGPLKATALARLLGQADAIQTVSLDAQANLRSHLRLPSRCDTPVSLSGIDIDQFARPHPNDSSLRAALSVSPDRALFGFLGRMMPEKGFDLVIDAVRILARRGAAVDQFQVTVVSDGAYIREYGKVINGAGLQAYFHFAGFVPDVAPILHDLDAVLMPSRWEACGLLAMESLVAGCPLIASTCPGLREVIEGTPAIGIPVDDAEALARAMTQVLEHRHELKRATEQYVPVAMSRFDANRVAIELDSLFGRVVNRRRANG